MAKRNNYQKMIAKYCELANKHLKAMGIVTPSGKPFELVAHHNSTYAPNSYQVSENDNNTICNGTGSEVFTATQAYYRALVTTHSHLRANELCGEINWD